MNLIYRCMFHALYIDIMISLLTEDPHYDWESTLTIALVACTVGVLTIEIFFRSNKNNYADFIKNPA